MADQFEEVPGGANNNNYANVRLIVDIAERTGVQVRAIHTYTLALTRLLMKSRALFVAIMLLVDRLFGLDGVMRPRTPSCPRL